ncbi:hypothetical protein F5Y16DRAFT_362038 [Xylariaceae sp. FL0255]|nr:hypothetical protein F5Y16DRAFT_362038 [Xylariaceae sp. FL0255]
MTKERKKAPAPAHGVAAATRRHILEKAGQHHDRQDWRNLNALKKPPTVKHRSYFEAVENADKKQKKLEFEITTKREPPPGFEFIPTGHPELTTACKERSREREAMFFIVSSYSKDTEKLDHHMNRLGCHFRSTIVDEARELLRQQGYYGQAAYVHEFGKPEPIPKTQTEMNEEADAVLRDLFPRIPHTDRQEIINHAFKKDGMFNGKDKVGMAKDITLARRVQLAALAHIRHTHTRYDQLLKESDWANARKAVEKPCLDVIVKWRGDEETGRDQLDEILREVIEISDSEGESDDEGSSEDNLPAPAVRTRSATAMISDMVIDQPMPVQTRSPNRPLIVNERVGSASRATPHTPTRLRGLRKAELKTARRSQRRFRRYAAAAEALAIPGESLHQDSSSTAAISGAPGELISRGQDSSYPVNSPGMLSSAAFQVSRPGLQNVHPEVRNSPITYANGFEVHQSPLRSRPLEATHEIIRVPDTQRPKVGPYSALQTRPPAPLSPVRIGLQDMLLPSVEPRSPGGPRAIQSVSQGVFHEHQHTEEFPRVISRTVVEPTVPAMRRRSPEMLVNDYDDNAKRRRVTTYFPEDFAAPGTSSYVQVAHSAPSEQLRLAREEYHPSRPFMVLAGSERTAFPRSSRAFACRDVPGATNEDDFLRSRAYPIMIGSDSGPSSVERGPERTSYHNGSWAAREQNPAYRAQDPPLRSRAHPIVIHDDDDTANRQPPRVIEVQPNHERYQAVAQTLGNDPRDDARRQTYFSGPFPVEGATQRPERVYNRDHHGPAPSFGRPVTYAEVAPQQMISERSSQVHNHGAEDRDWYSLSRDRGMVTVHQAVSGHVLRSDDTHGETSRLGGYPSTRVEGPQEYLRYDPVPNAGYQRPQDSIIYREARAEDPAPAFSDQRGPQQPFPVYPARSSYVEIRGPLNQQGAHDRRNVVYAD